DTIDPPAFLEWRDRRERNCRPGLGWPRPGVGRYWHVLRQRHDVFDLVGCSRQPAHQVGRARPLGHYLIRARPEAVGKRPGMIERSNAHVLPPRSQEQRSTRARLRSMGHLAEYHSVPEFLQELVDTWSPRGRHGRVSVVED